MFLRLLAIFTIIGTFLLPSPIKPTRPTRTPSSLAAPSSVVREEIRNPYIVVVAQGRDARSIASSAGVVPTHIYRRVINGFVATLTDGQRTALQHHPDVAVIEPDQFIAATGTQVIDLTATPGLWGLDRIDQQALPLDSSYTSATTGAGVTAYLIDSGIQADHPDFGTRALNVYNAFGAIGTDCHGHGTHLAGIVGGATYGVAKQVNLRGVRVLDCQAQGTVANAIAGIDWVATNAVRPAVATIAFSPVNLDNNNSMTLQLAIENLINAGVFVAVAAGNSNLDACSVAPGNVTAAFTVAASTRTDSRATFSNYGSCVDSYAPGSGITSAWIGSTTNTLSGTSQAAAFVAGAAALYKASAGDQTQAAIDAWLIANATPNVIQGNVGDTPNRLLYLAPPPTPVDTTPPVITLTTDPSDTVAPTGWYTSASSGTDGVRVNVLASDPAGVTTITCIDNSVTVLNTSASSGFFILGDGTHSIVCTASDGQGNTGAGPGSTPMPVTYKIDQTVPVTIASVSGSSGCASGSYAAGATVTLSANEPATIQYRINGGAWQTYSGPIVLTGAGVKTIDFFATDTAGNVEATKTITTTISSFPQNGVLDTFNRANGALGPNWAGATSTNNFQIASQRVDVRGDGSIYWNSSSPFGINQEAFVTLNVVDTNVDNQGLILKLQGFAPVQNGAISVVYNPILGGIRVDTFQPGDIKTKYPPVGGTLQNGDRLGVQVLANGQVLIYKNCTLVGTTTLTTADQNFFNTKGGRIGLWFTESKDTFFDDFGGGNVTP